jgi:hypothetical protein
MRIVYSWIFICGLVFVVTVVLLSAAPHALFFLANLISLAGLVICLIAALILGGSQWCRLSRWWFGPAVLSLVFILTIRIVGPLGVALGDWQFKTRINEYVRIVGYVRTPEANCGPTFAKIHIGNLPLHIDQVIAACCGDGSISVQFQTLSGIPGVHAGYCFVDHSATNNCFGMRPDWPYVRSLGGNWFRYSDQPGL